jgi:hypothetical protein
MKTFFFISVVSIITTSVLIFLYGCGAPVIPNRNVMPEEFRFVIATNGVPLINSQNFQIEMYYYKENKKEIVGTECMVPECKLIVPFSMPNQYYPFYYRTLSAPVASGMNGCKDFYIKIDNDIDTVYLDVQPLPPNDPSGGSYYYKQVKFNGKEVKISESVFPWAYILKK